jgi:hypothetical protein
MSAQRERLQQRYGVLLRVYPVSYRERHGVELLDTLLETSDADQAFPSARESAALVVAGARARVLDAAQASPRWWLDGLHLGVCLLALSLLLERAGNDAPVFSHWWFVLLALTVATMRGWVKVAAPVAIVVAFSVSRPLLYDGLPGWVNQLPVLGPEYGNLFAVAPELIIAAGLLVLAIATIVAGRRPTFRPGVRAAVRPRAWAWFLPLGLTFLHVLGLCPGVSSWRLVIAAIEVALLTAAFAASTTLAHDRRWAWAAAVYLTPGLVFLASNGAPTLPGLLYPAVVWLLALASAVAATAPRRRLQTPPVN